MSSSIYPQSLHSSEDDQIAVMEAPSSNAVRASTSNILHLPSHVLTEILSRLPIKTLTAAKSVCKSWLKLVSSDTHLAKLHRQRSASTELLLRPASTTFSFGNVQFHRKGVSKANPSLLFDLPIFDVTSNNTINFRKMNKNHLVFSNSCDGLICFHSTDSSSRYALIINPVTGEFITVPMSTKWVKRNPPIVQYGLGFSVKENRFKLLQVMKSIDSSKRAAEICTFEGGSKWRDVGNFPYQIIGTSLVFLEGKLHFGYAGRGEIGDGIACFDFDTEQFGVVPIPSENRNALKYEIGFGVLQGCLFLTKDGKYDQEIWVMKDYGVEDSWTKVYSIPYWYLQIQTRFLVPLKELENGEILVLCKYKHLVSYNPRAKSAKIISQYGTDNYLPQVIAYSPTLVRLKDALAGYEACIHNVTSRFRPAYFRDTEVDKITNLWWPVEEKLVTESPRQGSDAEHIAQLFLDQMEMKKATNRPRKSKNAY